MANNIIEFQAGREAAISGKPFDGRRSRDWKEGWEAIAINAPAMRGGCSYNGKRWA